MMGNTRYAQTLVGIFKAANFREFSTLQPGADFEMNVELLELIPQGGK